MGVGPNVTEKYIGGNGNPKQKVTGGVSVVG